ncbi:MAG: hypothetical protein ABIY70_01380 [Capsulimonas sp.]|uniref:hypothetical protein n=1 Tax=Capsulimonas sp. TaxID=2494211 RepID=UPI0032664871
MNGVVPVPNMQVIDRVSGDQDIIVRQWALRWEPILRESAPMEAAALRRTFLSDPAPKLRADALRASVAATAQDAADALWKSMSDSSGAVRLCARYHLRQFFGDVDFAAHYRAVLQEGQKHQEGAVSGLGETGKAGDFDLLIPYFDGSSREAQSALKSLSTLDGDRARPIVLQSLIDDRPGVRRTATKLLNRHVFDYESDLLMELWARRPEANAAVNLAAATLRLPPWLALNVLLSALEIGSADVAVLDALAQWRPTINRVYVAPPPSEELRHRLLGKISLLSRRIPDELVSRLAAAIQ